VREEWCQVPFLGSPGRRKGYLTPFFFPDTIFLPVRGTGGGKRCQGGNGGKRCQVPFSCGPYAIKTCRPHGSGKWCPRRLRNSDWKTQCGTQDALERVPDTALPHPKRS
jgi:hypothetical protein